MSDATNTVTAAIADDIPCRRCGYNLRGLVPTGLCPECGTAIAPSLVGNLLKQADSDWLERLRFGTSLKLWNILLVILVMVGAGIVMAAGLPPALVTILGIAGGALGLWATYLITAQEPRIALQEDPVTLRKALRACAAIAFVGGVISNTSIVTPLVTLLQLIGSVLGFAGIFVVWGRLLYYRRFAQRIPDPKLAKSTTLLMWILPIMTAFVFVFLVVSALVVAAAPGTAVTPAPGGTGVTVTAAVPGPSPSMGVGFLGGMCFFMAFGVYLILWYMRLLAKYRKAFRLAADESRRPSRLRLIRRR